MPSNQGSSTSEDGAPPSHHVAGAGAQQVPAQNGETKTPLLEDVMQLSRLGEIEPLKRLIESGKASADHKDHEGITPLHVSSVFPRFPSLLSKLQVTVGSYQQSLRHVQIPC